MATRKTPLRNLILASLFAGLMAISARLSIPLPAAPITLQVLFVLLTGALLPPLYAFAAQTVYVLAGLAGLPVFAKAGGPAYVFEPTFGFLLGFILAAWVIAMILKNRALRGRFFGIFLAALAGVAIIYLVGVPYGYLIFNRVLETGWSFKQVLVIFCSVYLWFDILKALLAALIAFGVHKRLKI